MFRSFEALEQVVLACAVDFNLSRSLLADVSQFEVNISTAGQMCTFDRLKELTFKFTDTPLSPVPVLRKFHNMIDVSSSSMGLEPVTDDRNVAIRGIAKRVLTVLFS